MPERVRQAGGGGGGKAEYGEDLDFGPRMTPEERIRLRERSKSDELTSVMSAEEQAAWRMKFERLNPEPREPNEGVKSHEYAQWVKDYFRWEAAREEALWREKEHRAQSVNRPIVGTWEFKELKNTSTHETTGWGIYLNGVVVGMLAIRGDGLEPALLVGSGGKVTSAQINHAFMEYMEKGRGTIKGLGNLCKCPRPRR